MAGAAELAHSHDRPQVQLSMTDIIRWQRPGKNSQAGLSRQGFTIMDVHHEIHGAA